MQIRVQLTQCNGKCDYRWQMELCAETMCESHFVAFDRMVYLIWVSHFQVMKEWLQIATNQPTTTAIKTMKKAIPHRTVSNQGNCVTFTPIYDLNLWVIRILYQSEIHSMTNQIEAVKADEKMNRPKMQLQNRCVVDENTAKPDSIRILFSTMDRNKCWQRSWKLVQQAMKKRKQNIHNSNCNPIETQTPFHKWLEIYRVQL